ncbi:MAG: glutamate-5-semialdehyde dehydrogenase, partial [Deltaproteobacteria bacterium]|nr:glutamate-5-semialdehyde dehydrogenase [Deltaproteobacteria bacterium]
MNREEIANAAKKAKEARKGLSRAPAAARSEVLVLLAGAARDNVQRILAANARDVKAAGEKGLPGSVIDRLLLTEDRCRGLSQSLLEVAALPDPLGAVEDLAELPNGLLAGRMRVPLGVLAFICEARPGAVVEAAGMALKSGNAIIVKPGKESRESSRVLGELIGEAVVKARLPENSVLVLADMERGDVAELLKQEDSIDLVIPRGGEGLIRFVAENSRIPVLKHYKGVCHLFADRFADLDMAVKLAINGKANRPATCNALETLLVHEKIRGDFLNLLAPELVKNNIVVKADERGRTVLAPLGVKLAVAEESDYDNEYLNLTLNLRVVDSFAEALDHIEKHGSRHTDAIVTTDLERARTFLETVDSS